MAVGTTDYEWQRAFPIDLIKYMAVRLFYERELVTLACQDKLAIPAPMLRFGLT